MTAWKHYPSFLQTFFSQSYADRLYESMLAKPWQPHPNDGLGAYALYYGTPYGGQSANGGVKNGAKPILPGLQNLADKVSSVSKSPVNYIQCHLFAPGVPVRPHFDPGGMIVPMLTIGQERTFRVGGTMPAEYYNDKKHPENYVEQKNRDVSKHIPVDNYLMKSGDLLGFIGGNTIHSMFPASQDSASNLKNRDWRISIIFRYTTDAMRNYGPGSRANKAGTKEQYKAAVDKWREENGQ